MQGGRRRREELARDPSRTSTSSQVRPPPSGSMGSSSEECWDPLLLKSGHRQVPRSPSSSSPQEPDPLLPQVRTPPIAGIPFFLKSSSSREWSVAAALAPAAGAGRDAGPGSGVRRRVLQECYGVGKESIQFDEMYIQTFIWYLPCP